MQDPNSAAENDHHHHNNNNATASKRKSRFKRPIFKVLLPGQIAFRIVCQSSIIGGLIGSSGSFVSSLRQQTGCKIHCEDSVPATEERTILVIGSILSRKGVTLIGVDGDGGGGEVEVSSAQEAMLRIYERIWELEVEKRNSVGLNREVMCKLLAHTSQIGAVVGKGRKSINTIRNNSGAKIRVCPSPHCAPKDQELILITGRILAVKKALIGVSQCLQDCPPLAKVPASLTTPTINNSDRSTSSSDPDAELFPHLSSWIYSMEGLSLNDASKGRNSNGASGHDSKGTECEVAFRLLCSNNVAGSVIGRKGAIVRALECKTGASITFAPPLAEFAERIITISAIEKLESSYSPAQDAIVLVFARIIEEKFEKGFLTVSDMSSPVTARLLVSSSTINYLSGNEGRIISELKEVTGCDIQILYGEPLPSGATDSDVVVQITGGYRSVPNALYKITCSIKDNIPNEVLPEARMKSKLKAKKDPLKGNHFAHGKSASTSVRFLPKNAGVHAAAISENGHTDLSGNSGHGRGNKLATVTNTTVEIKVSEHVFGSVYGEDGGNLDRIKQISGASVTVYDPSVGTSGGRVVISGTPDQTFAAQSLLQAFIQAGQIAPES
ncbi:hypothetical protein TanjilG_25540 [Lupinus angustifolius]|uniref:K Homology domain-containing protein n=1 Tax=Lupinus angustifolius TaxID=3871 RepID=A0A4P1QTB2_LUPAN|nr:PREDICTED: KH domain-containing protein HEN4-like [Lupinus angustifolius]OIV94478.1 hypothetical protein TanjilG_25540 [Lupinus angustifolius]